MFVCKVFSQQNHLTKKLSIYSKFACKCFSQQNHLTKNFLTIYSEIETQPSYQKLSIYRDEASNSPMTIVSGLQCIELQILHHSKQHCEVSKPLKTFTRHLHAPNVGYNSTSRMYRENSKQCLILYRVLLPEEKGIFYLYVVV